MTASHDFCEHTSLAFDQLGLCVYDVQLAIVQLLRLLIATHSEFLGGLDIQSPRSILIIKLSRAGLPVDGLTV